MKKIIIMLIMIPQCAFAQRMLQALKSDLQEKKMTYEEYLVYKALAIFQPDMLAPDYQELLMQSPIKSGTFIIADIKRNWDKLSSENQRLLETYFYRPTLPYHIISPSGQFRIHYATAGNDAVSSEDQNQDGIPDYVEQTAAIFDYSHKFQTDSLGYNPPPGDGALGGGPEYDVYIQSLSNGMYGDTWFEGYISNNSYRCYSYMRVDNDYKGSGYYSQGLDGLRVTAAHEYFHAIQAGYKFYLYGNNDFFDDEVFYYEVSAVWMEDMVFDEINDYYSYLEYFFENINQPFNLFKQTDARYAYANALWNHMLTQKYGHFIVREIWEEIVGYPALEAIDRVLHRYGSNFNNEFIDYSLWNYFTGSRSDTINYYSEGADYPEVSAFNYVFSGDTTITGKSSHFGYSYYTFYDVDKNTTITLIPVNFETDIDTLLDIKFELRRGSAPLFKPITPDFKVRMIVDNYYHWAGNAVVMDSLGNALIDFNPIEESMITRDQLILGYGPNPYVISKHQPFKVSYQLKEESTIAVSIFTETGRKIEDFQLGRQDAGSNHFSWDPSKYGKFPGGSGIYVLLLKVNNAHELIKFAVIR